METLPYWHATKFLTAMHGTSREKAHLTCTYLATYLLQGENQKQKNQSKIILPRHDTAVELLGMWYRAKKVSNA